MQREARDPIGDMEARIQSHAPDLGLSSQACLMGGELKPCTVVVFGASGDLTARKLMPALYNLHLNGALPTRFLIVGCARKQWSRLAFQEEMKRAVREAGSLDGSRWESFARLLYYQPLTYDDEASYRTLAETLGGLDRQHHTGGNRIFELAIPPFLYKTTSEMLGRSGLGRGEGDGTGWSRIVVEKPFGNDLETAKDLDQTLHQWFREEQVFRIDHYLAKETVQNILIFRFANAIFEPIWNRGYIDHVGVLAAENLGVEHRASYYEQAGVLRDMFQNHMMQLLSMIAMEPPSVFEAERVRDEKVKVFRSLKPLNQFHQEDSLILGQYGPGVMEGREVSGYRQEDGVDPASLTPTFAIMRVFVDNWRWKGVPFYMVSGKRMRRKLTQIAIQFKEVPHSMFQSILGESIMANRLILEIYPEEKITLTFQTKNPGATVYLRSVTMDFKYYMNYTGPRLDAYEKVLLDCIQGDHMLFWREDAVEQCWGFLTPVLEECESCPDRMERLHAYTSGSWGPEEARSWMARMIPGL